MPFVFTEKELDHCMRLKSPAAGLCAAFCVKEAMLKVLRRPYDFTGCEFFLSKSGAGHSLVLSGRVAGRVVPRVKLVRPDRSHFAAAVYLFAAP